MSNYKSDNALTADQVKHIKAAAKRQSSFDDGSAFVVDWRKSGPNAGYGLTIIDRVAMPEGFEPPYSEKRTRVTCDGRIDRYYSTNTESGRSEFYTYRPSADSAERYVTTLSTAGVGPFNPMVVLARVLRAGDVLHVTFTLSNDNGNLRDANLTHDTCDLAVIRGNNVVCLIRFGDVIAPPDSLGGMIDPFFRAERDGAGL